MDLVQATKPQKPLHKWQKVARVKSSMCFFDVTGNMTLLCHHDCSLFMVNMTTPGEAQYYVLALIAKLFEHCPPQTMVKVLYDIGCQLDQSCWK